MNKAPKNIKNLQAPRSPLEQAQPVRRVKAHRILEKETALAALKRAFLMLRPDLQWNNPVMFVVEIGAILTLLFIVQKAWGNVASQVPITYFIALDIWLFLTVLFANFATALAEARGKAQADSLRRARHDTVAYRLNAAGAVEEVSSAALRAGDRVVVQAGQTIPGDGDIIEGVASIDESAITGESAPVIREKGGDRSSVTGGTIVLSDSIIVEITSSPGESFLDRMIALVEGAIRQRTPNEIALTLFLSGFTLVFLIVVIPLWAMAWHAEHYMTAYLGLSAPLKSLGTDIPTLIALVVCLIPTTIGALLAAIGMLDKTGTITIGNRKATTFHPIGAYSAAYVGRLAALASAADETPEGKSIVQLYEEQSKDTVDVPADAKFVHFTAQTRMSGIDLAGGQRIRKGAPDAIIKFVEANQGDVPKGFSELVDSVASQGATPLAVVDGGTIVGVISLEDILKPHMSERFERLRRMGLRTVMITGDNPLTAAAIAKQAGVDDFLAQATPETKLAYIRKEQAEGKLVAMMGDGTNDAPALAQADVGVAMNAGTQAAKEAANMVDLDSDPTKLIEVVEVGKQLLVTRGSLTTFSIANDVAKYFAIIPALFAGTLPWMKVMDVMQLHSPTSAILSAVIFNALIIPALIPVALKGVKYQPLGANALLRRNLLIWGLGGVILPFIGIKLIDLTMASLHLVS
jgi:K+-transporting ATPase ATPase B chain